MEVLTLKLKSLLLSAAILIALTGCSAERKLPAEAEDRFKSVISIQNDAMITGAQDYEVSSGLIGSWTLGEHIFESFQRVTGINYYDVWGFNNNGDIIFTFHDAEKNSSEIGAYNIQKGTYQTLTKSPEGLVAWFGALNDRYIVSLYSNTDIDGETNGNHNEIHCLDIGTGEDFTVMSFDDTDQNTTGYFTFIGDVLYFDVYGDIQSDILDTKVCKYIPGGEVETVSEKARLTMPYNGGIAYIKNNDGVYALTENGEELLFDAEFFGDLFGISCSNDIFTYKYDIYGDAEDPECATGNGVGFINGGEKTNLFESAAMALYFSEITFNGKGYGVWDSDPLYAVVPAFYDCNKNSFVIVDDTPMSYRCFSNDSSVLFISINEQTQSAFYYLVT